MKILHVVRGLNQSSGTTHAVIPLAEEQARLGHKVTVFHITKPGQESLVPDPALVESVCFPMTISSVHFGFSLSFARAMRRRVRKFDVVHIHAVWNFATYWAMRCAWRAGVPYIVAPQGSFDSPALRLGSVARRLYERVEAAYFGHATAFQALSANEEDQIRRYGIEVPVMRLPNGVNVELFDKARGAGVPSLATQLGLPAGAKTILFLGRIHPKKGLDRLIRAMSNVIRELPQACLVIAGHDGENGYARQLQELAGDIETGHVTWMGEVSGKAKLDALLGADVFCLPSFSEGLPVAALEALAAGLSCVMTPECNLPDIGTKKAGVIVENDPNALATALVALLVDDPLRVKMGEAARRVAAKYDWKSVASESVQAYREVLKKVY